MNYDRFGLRTAARGLKPLLITAGAILAWAGPLAAQDFAQGRCTVSVLNQTANVLADGTWEVPNIPSNMGPVRARVSCVADDETLSGSSDLFTITPNRMNAIPRIVLGSGAATPASILLQLPVTTFETPGQAVQATVTARFADGSTRDVTAAATGTTYLTSNPAVVTVGPDGRVEAVGSGRAMISALHEAILDAALVTAILSPDSDGDGLPDDLELSLGLDPQDPVDALEDLDGDGLTNFAEFELGTRLDLGDSDGDGVADGEEVVAGRDGFVTNPLLADSDGDGVPDGLEIEVGTDPTDRASVDYGAVLLSISVEPGGFTLVKNTVLPDEVSRRVRVGGLLVDGSDIDLTARPGTTYSSSDLTVANFGAEPGRIFAGNDGTATVTAANAGFSTTVAVNVTTFSPRALSFLHIPGFANAVAVDGGFAYVAAGATGLQVVDVSNPSSPAIVSSLDTAGNANDLRVRNGIVYLADGADGVVLIDVADPRSPIALGTVDTPGVATDIAVAAGRAYVADGSAGVAVLDVSNPSSPRLLGRVDTPGNARGIDANGDLVVVADGVGGVHVLDVSNPAAPVILGSTHTRGTTSRAADVVVRDRTAFVADGSNTTLGGLKVVDFTEPSVPVVVGATSDGFGLVGVAVDRNVVLAADYFFVNAVPVFDVRQTAPSIRGTVDFSTSPSFRDDNGNGVAARLGLAFLVGARFTITDNGVSGDTGLHIGRYAVFGDDFGIAPEVRLTAPADGSTVVERRVATLSADASDDVLVESVQFLVDGEPVGSDFSPPFELDFTVPAGATTLRLGAVATDLGGNQGSAEDVVVTVLPDSAPTVRILSPTEGSRVTEGAVLPLVATATDDVFVASLDLLVDGAVVATTSGSTIRFDFPVPLAATELAVTAVATDDLGQSATAGPVVVGVEPNQPPSVEIVEPADGAEVVEGATVRVVAGATDDVGVAAVRFFVDGAVVLEDPAPPFELDLSVPVGATQVVLSAEAEDGLGQVAASPEVTLSVIPDPGTTVEGSVVLEDGTPAAGATVSAFEASTTSFGDGTFVLEGVPTVLGPFTVNALLETEAGTLRGSSAPVAPLPGGVIDVGAIVVSGAEGIGMVVDDGTNSVVVFDGDTDTVLGVVPLVGGPAMGDCSITDDGTRGFVTDFASRLWVIDLEATPPRLAAAPNPIPISNRGEDTSISPDGRFVVVCDGSAFEPVSVVDIAARSQVSTFHLGTDCNSVEVCDDGSVLVTSTTGRTRRLTLDSSGVLADTGDLLLTSEPNNVLCAPGTGSGLVITRGANRVRSFTVPGLAPVDTRSFSGFFGISGVVHPSGDRVFTRSNGGAVDVFDFDPLTGALGAAPRLTIPIAPTPTFFGMDQMALHPDGSKLYVSQPGALRVYDPDTGELLRTITNPALSTPTGICFAGLP